MPGLTHINYIKLNLVVNFMYSLYFKVLGSFYLYPFTC